jgi:hypothetical protein
MKHLDAVEVEASNNQTWQWLYDKIAKPNTRMIEPRNGKDMDDECIKGTIHNWLNTWEIEPNL